MKHLVRPAALLSLLAITPFLHARLEENLPATTYGLMKVESVSKARKHLDANPVAIALKGPKFADFFKPLTEKMASDPEASAKLADLEKHRDEVLAAFTGEVVFAVTKTPNPFSGHAPYDFVLLADTTLDETGMAELLKKLDLHQPRSADAKDVADSKRSKSDAPAPQADGEDDDEAASPMASPGAKKPRLVPPDLIRADEDHRGITLHTLQVKVDDKPVTVAGWAIVEKTLVYATAPNVLRDLVDARREGRKDSFAAQAVYKTNADALEDSDAWMLLNMPLIAGSLRDLITETNKDDEGNPKPGLMGMDVLKSFDSLGLDAIRHVRLNASFAPDDTRLDTSIAWSEARGLVKFITDTTPKDARPDLAVIPAGVMGASAARCDLSKVLAQLESMLRDAFPLAAPMLDLQLDKVKKQEGLDVRSALLANFGDEFWSFTDPLPASAGLGEEGKPPQAPTVLVFSIKDENKLASFIETLAGKAAPQTGDGVKSLFEERELLGAKVRAFKNLPPGAPRIQYALHKGRLFLSLGDGKLLDRTLAQFNSPKGGLAADPAFKEALSRLPKNSSAVNYYDLGEYASTFCRAFAFGANSAARTPKDADTRMDPAKAPSPSDLPFIAVGNSVVGDNEATSTTLLLRKPDSGR